MSATRADKEEPLLPPPERVEGSQPPALPLFISTDLSDDQSIRATPHDLAVNDPQRASNPWRLFRVVDRDGNTMNPPAGAAVRATGSVLFSIRVNTAVPLNEEAERYLEEWKASVAAGCLALIDAPIPCEICDAGLTHVGSRCPRSRR